jgi:hypothetical protein
MVIVSRTRAGATANFAGRAGCITTQVHLLSPRQSTYTPPSLTNQYKRARVSAAALPHVRALTSVSSLSLPHISSSLSLTPSTFFPSSTASRMDVKRLQNLVMDSSATNSTLSSLPSTLLDATIPGYGIISQLIFRLFGIDIGLVVSGCLIVFGIFQGAQSLYKRSYTYYLDYFTASIEIENDDDLYDSVVSW